MNDIHGADEFIAPKCIEQIHILYQDKDILLINKPSGLLSLSGKHPANIDSVHYRIKQLFPSALMCHRLDFGTSGVMLIALNKSAITHINRQFELRSVRKVYQAVLMGIVADDQGVLTYPIAKSDFPLQKICASTGKYSESQFTVHKRCEYKDKHLNRTEVIFMPKTGRTHQLRVHANAYGHSILGDDLYGSDACLTLSNRLMLHAYSIEFAHPTQSKRMHVHAPSIFS